MINWYSITVEMQRRQDEIAKAAAENHSKHIMRRPVKSRKASGHIMAEVLIHTGNWLVGLGCRLQERYVRLAMAAQKGIQQDHIMTPQTPCTS